MHSFCWDVANNLVLRPADISPEQMEQARLLLRQAIEGRTEKREKAGCRVIMDKGNFAAEVAILLEKLRTQGYKLSPLL